MVIVFLLGKWFPLSENHCYTPVVTGTSFFEVRAPSLVDNVTELRVQAIGFKSCLELLLAAVHD